MEALKIYIDLTSYLLWIYLPARFGVVPIYWTLSFNTWHTGTESISPWIPPKLMYLVFSFNTWHSGTGSISPWIPSKLMYLVFLLLRPKVKLLMIFVCFVFTACITLEMFSHFTFVPDKESLVSDAGKLHVLDSLLERLKNENHRVLIYSQMTRMIDLLEVSTPQSEFCFVLFLKNTDHLSLGIFCH